MLLANEVSQSCGLECAQAVHVPPDKHSKTKCRAQGWDQFASVCELRTVVLWDSVYVAFLNIESTMVA